MLGYRLMPPPISARPNHTHGPLCPARPRNRRGGWRAACAEEAAKTWRPYRLFNMTDTVSGDPALQAARGREIVAIISEGTAALLAGPPAAAPPPPAAVELPGGLVLQRGSAVPTPAPVAAAPPPAAVSLPAAADTEATAQTGR